MQTIEITDSNFQSEVLNSDIPVLIDFGAVWCGPCKAIAPIVDQLAIDYQNKLKVGKIDVDDNRDTAIKFGIRSVPTVLIFKNGKEVDRILGGFSRGQIEEKIKAYLD